MVLGDDKLKLSKLIEALDPVCLFQRSLKHFRRTDACWVPQIGRNLHDSDEIADLKLAARLDHLTRRS